MDRSAVVRRLVLVALTGAALLAAGLLAGCGDDGVDVPTATAGTVEVIDPAQAAALFDADRDVLVIDVRPVEEYRTGHLVGAQNIDLSDEGLWERRTSALDPDRATVIYCDSGSSCPEASRRLVDAGFTEVYDLGGIQEWSTGELPLDES